MTKPWESVPDLWKDERAYLNWLRGQIRRIWSRHPIKHRYIQARPSVGIIKLLNGNRVPERDVPLGDFKLSSNTKELKCCEMCDHWFPKGRMEVDHEVGGVGFADYDEFLDWQHRMLFVSFEDIKHLCKPCHLQVTLSQKYHCHLDDVWVHQKIAEFNKLPAKKKVKALVELCGNDHGCTNDTQRKALYKHTMLQEKKHD